MLSAIYVRTKLLRDVREDKLFTMRGGDRLT